MELVRTKVETVTYKRRAVRLPSYRLLVDGEVVGTVERAMLTRERRTPGRRYVNARWQSPGWRYRRGIGWARGFECSSRRDGVEQLLRDSGLAGAAAVALAASVPVRDAEEAERG